jgi:hypothetical protein
MPDEASPKEGHDVVLLHSRTRDGQGYRALRSRPDRLEAAEIRPLKTGQPLTGGEVVSLKEREGSPVLWDVKVELSNRPSHRTRQGPAQYASDSYLKNYEAIFGHKRRRRARPRGGDPEPGTLN